MCSLLGRSVYISTFEDQMEKLSKLASKDYYIFTSFHIQEEFCEDYIEKAKELCYFLNESGFRIIGDISPKTLNFFRYENINCFAQDMGLDILRIDYGFSMEEVLHIDHQFGIAFNASTLNYEEAKILVDSGKQVYAIHNYYPRPETGLDDDYFKIVNHAIHSLGIKVLAFIPGDETKRGPIKEGLPTLESHRNLPPYIGFLDLTINFNIDIIFIGDLQISDEQESLIETYNNEKTIILPVIFSSKYEHLYETTFTIRVDSPNKMMRLQESREYSCPGTLLEPYNCIERKRGAITIDNEKYGRYSGEIQVMRQDLPQDDRVNVIGHIEKEYLKIIKCIHNNARIRFKKADHL